MSITTNDNKKGALPLPLLIVLVQGLVLAGLWLAQPWLRSHMQVDKSELEAKLEEVKKRSEERKKKEEEQRRKKKLKKEDVEKLKKEARKKNERKIRDKIEEMDEIRKELKQEKREMLEAAKEDEIQDTLEELADQLQQQVAALQEQAQTINRDSQDEHADELEQQTDALKKLADELKEQPQYDVADLQQAAASADQTANKLQEIQEAARTSPSERNKVGREHQTKDYRERLDKVNKELESIADQSFQEQLDFEQIDQMIADEGMQLDADQLLAMELDELYDVARELEQEIAADYAAMRAAELSAIQDREFNETFEHIAENKPQRRDFDFDAMMAELDTLGDVSDLREHMSEVAQEVESMKQNAQNMQGQSQGFQRMQQGQQGQGQQAARQQLAMQQAISSAAQMQHGKSIMLDMSAQMRAAYSSGGRQGDTLNPENKQSQSMLAAGKVNKKRIRVDTRMIKAKALPGRKFTDASSREGWLYIDTWYIIGPWQIAFTKNRQVNWSKIHPPEYEIDLAKTYTGKKGKELKWQFTQSNTLRITPPDEQSDSTYYCYTEVYFDQDRDMLLAIASDDAAKVWVNDILVWQDNGLSAWSLDEGFRKVAFKKGFNKVLLRIANGPVVCQYSLLLCPPDLGSK